MQRNQVARTDQLEQVLELLATGVAADVHARIDHLVDDARPAAEEVVDRARDRLLVAGHRAGAEDDRVVRLNLDQRMIAASDAAEHAGRLALAASRQQHHLVGRQVVDLAQLDQAAFGNVHEAELARDAQVLFHAAADDRGLRPSLCADRTTSRRRPILEAKVVTSTRPGALPINCSSASRTPDSEAVQPPCSTRTQSLSSTSTPSSPAGWLDGLRIGRTRRAGACLGPVRLC